MTKFSMPPMSFPAFRLSSPELLPQAQWGWGEKRVRIRESGHAITRHHSVVIHDTHSDIFCFCISREQVRNRHGTIVKYIRMDWDQEETRNGVEWGGEGPKATGRIWPEGVGYRQTPQASEQKQEHDENKWYWRKTPWAARSVDRGRDQKERAL